MQLKWIAVVAAATFAAASSGTLQEDAAKGLMKRLLGDRARSFTFHQIPKEGNLDVFEVKAAGGNVEVKGSTGVAMARGAYHYLRQGCHVLVTWDGDAIALPEILPDFPKTRVVCPNRYRHYFNVCTFGYTMTWWDWKRWEREIDWMALHGIDMPLAMTGQEAIWQKVFLDLGVARKDVDTFFTGPAFLPWHRMGNVDGHAGPLPQSWIKGQLKLQRRILRREQDLGMTPVTPGFSGFVPAAFAKAHPESKITRSSGWCGFEPTYMVDAQDPLFGEIGKRFIREYHRQIGTSHLYLCDTFNEMTPQLPAGTKLRDLEAMGKAIYRSILAGDPEGTWVMQGWLFLDRGFWGTKEADAMLRPVPDDRMAIFDLGADQFEVWRVQPAVRQKQWIWCTLHNFGQTTALFGNLEHFATAPIKALNDSSKADMAGMGITPEGIEQNSVVYELATDTMWRTEPLDVNAWVRDYARCRYGALPPAAASAWKMLLKTVYAGEGSAVPQVRRPSLGSGLDGAPTLKRNRELTELLLTCGDALKDSQAYRRDLVDVEKHWLESVGSVLIDQVYLAYDTGNSAALAKASKAYMDWIDDLDRLLATRPEYRLSRWVKSARAWGRTPAEKALFEMNARTQVTVWGGPVLYDYAWKEWAGLTKQFYKPRWKMLLDALAKGHLDAGKLDQDLARWEFAWANREQGPMAEGRLESTVTVARELAAKYANAARAAGDPGIAVGKPVTDSGHIEDGHVSSLVTDGYTFGDYWSAYPYPQWVQIDLGEPARVGGVRVFPYWDGERYYRYKIETSLDGRTWTLVADMSKSTEPAQRRGRLHAFEPLDARYVRVTMLFNSANPGVHLYEVQVFPPKVK